MADQYADEIGVEPTVWFLIFEERSRSWWVDLLAWGRFKHVTAVGWVSDQRLWLFYDVSLGRTRVAAMPDCPGAWEIIAAMREQAVTLVMPPGRGRNFWARIGFWCVPAMAHLVGVRSHAMRPDRLFAHCLGQGGQVMTFQPDPVCGADEAATPER